MIRNVSDYSIKYISIGNSIRIEDYCTLVGNLHIRSLGFFSACIALYGEKRIYY
jgi:hypothetical protein